MDLQPHEHPSTTRVSDDAKLLALMVLLCGSVIAIGMTLSQKTPAVSPFVLGDISEAHIVEIRDERGAAVLSGEFRSRVDGIGNTELDAQLRDQRDRRVIGEVELEIPARGRTHLRPELEVDIMGLPARQRFVVVIDDRIVGTFVADDRGSADFELQEGEFGAGQPSQ
jgi:hypothetical protein